MECKIVCHARAWDLKSRRSSLSILNSIRVRAFAQTTLPPQQEHKQPQLRRYAVLGAGFAGLSVTWHLLQHSSPSLQISVDLYDEKGIGAGASGASGGLLHPYSPKGKLIWKGEEGWTAALDLLNVAEAARQRAAHANFFNEEERWKFIGEPIVRRRGLIRPPASPKHIEDFKKSAKVPNEEKSVAGICCIDGKRAKKLIPGLAIPTDDLALYISEGLSIDPLRYLEGLWVACQLHARDLFGNGSAGSQAVFKRKKIETLTSLTEEYDGVIVCLGASISTFKELLGRVPINLCRGVVAHLELPQHNLEKLQMEGPSIVGETWLAMQSSSKLVLGATKDYDNTDPTASLSPEATATACKQLFDKAESVYPPIREWAVKEVRTGIRAMPKRTALGRLPMVGCIDHLLNNKNPSSSSPPLLWLLGGLGSRGLIHHAWLGKIVAEAVICGSEEVLPLELLQWKQSVCLQMQSSFN